MSNYTINTNGKTYITDGDMETNSGRKQTLESLGLDPDISKYKVSDNGFTYTYNPVVKSIIQEHELPEVIINGRNIIDKQQGRNSTNVDPASISDFSALFGDSRDQMTQRNFGWKPVLDGKGGYVLDDNSNPIMQPIKWTDTNYFKGQKEVNQAIANTTAGLFLGPSTLEGITNIPSGLKGLWEGGKYLYNAYKLNPLWGAYLTSKPAVPLATSMYAANKMGQIVDKTMKSYNGMNWAQNISNTTGLPEWMSDFTNPGYAIGGTAGFKYPYKYFDGVTKRGIEMAMRTTDASNPVSFILSNLKELGQNPSRIPNKLNYLLFGKKGTTGYNNLISFPIEGYNGDYSRLTTEGSPLDLALGISKTPDPRIGKLASDKDYGGLTDYIKNHPEYKDAKIVDVITEKNNNFTFNEAPTIEQIKSGDNVRGSELFGGLTTKGGAELNIAGHTIEYRINPITNEIEQRRLDLWKFNPEDYWKKWLSNYKFPDNYHSMSTAEKQNVLKPIINDNWKNRSLDFGLRLVNSNIKPYIYRTDWSPVNNFFNASGYDWERTSGLF